MYNYSVGTLHKVSIAPTGPSRTETTSLEIEMRYVKLIFLTILVWIPLSVGAQEFNPGTGQENYRSKTYFLIYTGFSTGALEEFYAESAFTDPNSPSNLLWTANVLDVSTNNTIPQIGIKFGGWNEGIGGELDISFLSHYTPAQIVYYDSHGQIFFPPTSEYPDGAYYPVGPDSVDLPDKFLKFKSFSFGGQVYLNVPFIKNMRPYIGIGLSFGMNNVSSDYPGPGSYAAKNILNFDESESLNTTDFGWGIELPIGIKYISYKKMLFSIEFRVSQKYISFVSSDAYQKEKDKTTLQTFQLNLGMGKLLE